MLYVFTVEAMLVFEKSVISLETLHGHQLVHNDIKPQNYLVKFLNGPNDLTQIDIVLTDFGLIGRNSKGGTPIFGSPECFEVKTNVSDIFSLGRVFLFMMLPKDTFLKFLYVAITSSTDKIFLENSILNQNDLIGLITAMIKTEKSTRIPLSQVRTLFNGLKRNFQITLNSFAKAEIERIVTQYLSPENLDYIQDLNHIS